MIAQWATIWQTVWKMIVQWAIFWRTVWKKVAQLDITKKTINYKHQETNKMKLLLLELEKRKSFSKTILISAGQRHTVVKVLANCFHNDCPFGHEKKKLMWRLFFCFFLILKVYSKIKTLHLCRKVVNLYDTNQKQICGNQKQLW